MKANNVGQRVTGKFNFHLYLEQKYEGFWPENMPTRRQIHEAKVSRDDFGYLDRQAQYKKLLSRYNGTMKEWMRLQKN